MISSASKYKKYCLLVLVLAALPMVVVSIYNYSVDPLQIYRKQANDRQVFWSNQRSQNAGKIRNYLADDGYDSILVGNSVADNFRPSQIEDVLHWRKCLKLTVGGGHASEQAYIIEQALERSDIKNVLWVIRAPNFSGVNRESWHGVQKIPFYLYSETIFDDYPYLFSIDTFSMSKMVSIDNEVPSGWSDSLDRLNYWMSKKHIKRQLNYNSKKSLRLLQNEIVGSDREFSASGKIEFPACDYNLVRILKKHTKVNFIVVIAPMTRQSLIVRDPRFLSRHFGFHDYLVRSTSVLNNVKLFGFENDDIIVNNIANFRDPVHYHSGINKLILGSIAKGDNRLDENSVSKYIANISKKISIYKVYSNFDEMIPLALAKERRQFNRLYKKYKNDNIIVREFTTAARL